MGLEFTTSVLALGGFLLAFRFGRVAASARRTVRRAQENVTILLDSEKGDAEKEIAARAGGLAILIGAADVLWRGVFALVCAFVPVGIADALGLVAQGEVYALMLSGTYIVLVSVSLLAVGWLLRKRPSSPAVTTSLVNQNSAVDRFFHVLAFSHPAVLKTVSRFEDRVMPGGAVADDTAPIFVTSLARGGTTALLQALHATPGVATHTYRDMPFLTAPVLWKRLSGFGGKRWVPKHERAHQDGIQIDLDSPEAFEEVLWKLFWPERFEKEQLEIWRTDCRNPEADHFLRDQMSKVARVRASEMTKAPHEALRYCSKNNNNIARIPYLLAAFPDCQIVVPVRRPDCHAASMLRQHQNFLQLHRKSDFSRRYMRDIGHYEFGLLHKPFLFPGFEVGRYDPVDISYWLYYWVCAFKFVLSYRQNCLFVVQDELREDPSKAMGRLLSTLQLTARPEGYSGYFHSSPDVSSAAIGSGPLHEEAQEIYRRLLDRP